MASELAPPLQLRLLGSSFYGSPHDRASRSRGTDSSASDETEWQLQFLGLKGAGWRRRVRHLGVSLAMLRSMRESKAGSTTHSCPCVSFSEFLRCFHAKWSSYASSLQVGQGRPHDQLQLRGVGAGSFPGVLRNVCLRLAAACSSLLSGCTVGSPPNVLARLSTMCRCWSLTKTTCPTCRAYQVSLRKMSWHTWPLTRSDKEEKQPLASSTLFSTSIIQLSPSQDLLNSKVFGSVMLSGK